MSDLPTIGRIVIVKVGDGEFPAIVQGVNENDTLRLSIFIGSTVLYRSQVSFSEEPKDYFWKWPTRVSSEDDETPQGPG